MEKLSIYLPFSKVEKIEKAGKNYRMVYGYASTEALDSQGEIVKLDALRDAIPEYMKFGNVREMHQASAVGKVKESNMDEKGWAVGIKVVDTSAINKVDEEIYSGLSIGGGVLEKEGNVITKLRVGEISLVDRPANPEAIFTVVKLEDGKTTPSEETTESSPANAPVAAQDAPEEPEETKEIGKSVHTAAMLVNMASDVTRIATAKEGPIDHLQEASDGLKAAAKIEMDSDDNDYNRAGENSVVSFADKNDDLEKATQTTETRNSLKNSDFAYIDSKGGRHLPINDAAHVRNAMARFNQTNFESDSAKSSAKKKICSKASTLGVEGDFCKLDDGDMGKDELRMPTDQEILDELKKSGVEYNERTIKGLIQQVKLTYADRIITKVNERIMHNHREGELALKNQSELAEAVTDMGKAFVDLPNRMPAGTLPRPVTDTIQDIPMAPPAELPAAPVAGEPQDVMSPDRTPAPTAPYNRPDAIYQKLELSEALEKVEGSLKKLNESVTKVVELTASLEERLVKVENTEAAPKIKKSFTVDRFEDGATSSKAQLQKRVDDVTEKVHAMPWDQSIRTEANKMSSEVLAWNRENPNDKII